MNPNKPIVAFLFIVVGCGAISCSHDECKNVDCLNDGTCINGDCNCIDGYSGGKCEIAPLDPCVGVSCQNGGACIDGSCDCAEWYEGSDCATEMREKFLINGAAATSCPFGVDELIDIIPGDEVNEIKIKRYITNSECTNGYYYVRAILTSSTTFTIPGQILCEGTYGGVSLHGSGVLVNDQLTIDYTISYYFEINGTNHNCTTVINM